MPYVVSVYLLLKATTHSSAGKISELFLQHCFDDCELLYVARTGSNKADLVNQKNQTTHWTDLAASQLYNLPLKFA